MSKRPPRSRWPLPLAVAAVGGLAYYVYRANANAQEAEKRYQTEIYRATHGITSAVPGLGSSNLDASKKLETLGSEAGAKIDQAGAKLDKAWRDADKQIGKAEAYAKDAKAEALKAVDKFDKTVENGASKAKSGFFSWFGGGK